MNSSYLQIILLFCLYPSSMGWTVIPNPSKWFNSRSSCQLEARTALPFLLQCIVSISLVSPLLSTKYIFKLTLVSGYWKWCRHKLQYFAVVDTCRPYSTLVGGCCLGYFIHCLVVFRVRFLTIGHFYPALNILHSSAFNRPPVLLRHPNWGSSSSWYQPSSCPTNSRCPRPSPSHCSQPSS